MEYQVWGTLVVLTSCGRAKDKVLVAACDDESELVATLHVQQTEVKIAGWEALHHCLICMKDAIISGKMVLSACMSCFVGVMSLSLLSMLLLPLL